MKRARPFGGEPRSGDMKYPVGHERPSRSQHSRINVNLFLLTNNTNKSKTTLVNSSKGCGGPQRHEQ